MRLKVLPENKTNVFYSYIEDDDVLVRTGTIQDNLSFYHAILRACSSEYVKYDTKKKMHFAKKIKTSLECKIDKENWEEIGLDLTLLPIIVEKIMFIFKNVYLFIAEDDKATGKSTNRVILKIMKNKDKNTLEYYKVIRELIPYDVLKDVVKKSKKKTSIKSFKINVLKDIIDYFKKIKSIKKLDAEKKKHIQTLLETFVISSIKEAEQTVYDTYVEKMKNATAIDSYTIESISEHIDRDIYFIDAESRMPYINSIIKGRKSIILLNINEHYEIVGKLLEDNIVQREFSSTDDIISNINSIFTKEITKKSEIELDEDKCKVVDKNSSYNSEEEYSEYDEPDNKYKYNVRNVSDKEEDAADDESNDDESNDEAYDEAYDDDNEEDEEENDEVEDNEGEE